MISSSPLDKSLGDLRQEIDNLRQINVLHDYDMNKLNRMITVSRDTLKETGNKQQHLLEQLRQFDIALNEINQILRSNLDQKARLEQQRQTDENDLNVRAQLMALNAEALECRAAAVQLQQEARLIIARAAELEKRANEELVQQALEMKRKQQKIEEDRAAELERRAKQQEEELQRKKKLELEKQKKDEEERLLKRKTNDSLSKSDIEQYSNWILRNFMNDEENPPCIVRVHPSSSASISIQVNHVGPVQTEFLLDNQEELIATPVELHFQSQNENESILVAIPYLVKRSTQRENVIKIRQNNGTWTFVETQESIFDSYKEKRFVQCKLTQSSICAVVSRLKREKINIKENASGRFSSTADPRLTLEWPKKVFSTDLQLFLKVQPIELSMFNQFRQNNNHECQGLITIGPIVDLNVEDVVLSKPLIFTLPILALGKKKISSTKSTNIYESAGNISTSQVSQQEIFLQQQQSIYRSVLGEDSSNERLILLFWNSTENCWQIDSTARLIDSKLQDIVTVHVRNLRSRMIVVRCEKQFINVKKVQTMMDLLETALIQRSVSFILRHREENPHQICLVCCSTKRVDTVDRELAEENYLDDEEQNKEVILQEGQLLELRFRGNVLPRDQHEPQQFTFNTFYPFYFETDLAEVDRYSQNLSSTFYGFIQIYLKKKILKTIPKENEKKKNSNEILKQEWTETEVCLAELVVRLPKVNEETTPFAPRNLPTFQSEGILTPNLFRELSANLNGDQYRSLARHLGVSEVRIESIERDFPEDTAYFLLLCWFKRVPKSADKGLILTQALIAINRWNLAQTLQNLRDEKRQEQKLNGRDGHLTLFRMAFNLICQREECLRIWKQLARDLSLSAEEIQKIEEKFPSRQERCLRSLERWSVKDSRADIPGLARALRSLGFKTLAREIDQMA